MASETDSARIARQMRRRGYYAIGAVLLAHAVVAWNVGAASALLVFSALVCAGAAWWAVSLRLDLPAPPAVRRVSPDDIPSPGSKIARSVLAGMPDPVLAVNAEGRIVLVNAAMRGLFRQAEEGRLLTTVIRSPALLEAVDAVLHRGGDREVDFLTPPPERWRFKVFCVAIETPDGDPHGLVLFHDMTAEMRVEQMRVDFIANASHELRTPLASLAGFIETLQGPAKDDAEAQEKFLAIMAKQAERMKRLIADLLSLSRIEIDEHVLPSERVNVAGVVRSVIDGLEPIAKDAGVTINFAAEEELPSIYGSQHELSQVALNLIDNAIKYGRSGGRVDVAVRLENRTRADHQPNTFVRLDVRDYGPGIPAEDVPRLTERFYRVDPEKSRAEGGTGLGLAIVKHIVNRHRGELEIKSSQGEGSAFSVLIPAISEAPAD